ncbi:MAG: hypothetical protein OEX04_11100 [Acidimicrobiia bacterium]|nr:hypothetical protein [Acidimicrobiia bacterium]MDH4308016.1 hypothetical protein [Acidimicrobiia bacterium]MDH5292289.1 hypothetical protein [Acidimicrobiia bacterium]
MALISDWGFFLKPGKEEEFDRWLDENEPRFTELAPPTYEYLGTYVPLWRGAGETAPFHQLWRYLSERPPDLRVAAGDGGGDFTDMAREFLSFVDETRSAEETFRLYRSARKAPDRT